MLGPTNQQHKSALWQTHPGWTGVGQHAVGGLDGWRWTSPRMEAALDAQFLEQRNRFLKMLMRRGVGSTPGFGPNQNPSIRASLSENRQYFSISRAERFDDPAMGPTPTPVDDLAQSCEALRALIVDQNSAMPSKAIPEMDDPETGPTPLERIGEPERLLLLTETDKKDLDTTIKPVKDGLETGTPYTSEEEPLSLYERNMAQILKEIEEIKLQQKTETQPEQTVPKAQDGQRGL
jgi:hypothetical protein